MNDGNFLNEMTYTTPVAFSLQMLHSDSFISDVRSWVWVFIELRTGEPVKRELFANSVGDCRLSEMKLSIRLGNLERFQAAAAEGV